LKRISSRDNAFFKQLRLLAHSSRERRKASRTLIDGVHLIQAARAAGQPIETVIVSDSGLAAAEVIALLQLCESEGVSAICLTDVLFAQLSPVDTPSGVLGVIPFPAPASSATFAGSLLVLEDIQDPGNLGTILRTAAAVGIEDVLLSGACAQVWHPRVLRAGMGGHFCLRLHEGLDVVRLLTAYTGRVLATVPGQHCRSLYAIEFDDQPVAWLFGGEGNGLSPELQTLAHEFVRIPMPGQVESLNVGTAVAVCLFEQLRQQGG